MRADESDPQALIVCPTRELAIQVAGEAERFGGHLGVRTVLAYGGTSSGDQKRALAAGADLVVGTPGRLLDFVNSAWLSLRRVRNVVLDEECEPLGARSRCEQARELVRGCGRVS